jgi:hypothetical protein
MSHSQIVCAYTVTAVGGQTIAALAAQFAAVPLDLQIPQLFGAMPIGDATTISGQTATRTITFQFAPAFPASATAILATPDGGGITLDLSGGENGDYGAPPIISFTGGNPVIGAHKMAETATATAQCVLLDAFIVNPGANYSAGSTAVLVGGDVDPRAGMGRAGSASPVIGVGGAVTGIDFLDRGMGYGTYPQVKIVDPLGTGSGAVIFVGLSIVNLTVFNPGNYKTAPGVVFTPKFQAMTPDTADQKSTLRGFMARAFAEFIRSPVTAVEPVVS